MPKLALKPLDINCINQCINVAHWGGGGGRNDSAGATMLASALQLSAPCPRLASRAITRPQSRISRLHSPALRPAVRPVLCTAQLATTMTELSQSLIASNAGDVASSGQLVAQLALSPAQAGTISSIASPVVGVMTILLLARVVMSWYPQLPSTRLPYAIAYFPTEPFLGPTRRLIPPVGGVDIAPLIWLAFLTLGNELLLGPQGLLILLAQKRVEM
eukprot:jgi/Chlat1/545/Chrsp103S01117